MPIEGIGGAVEKAAPLVKFPVLMRIVFPGTLAALCIYPFIHGWTAHVPPMSFLSSEWGPLIFALGAIYILGTLVSGLRGLTYRVYSDRLLWPPWLYGKLCAVQKSRVQRLLDEQERLPEHTPRYAQIWKVLRLYPMNDKGHSYASHPTLLGNIIAAYEKYPLTRYGMVSVFYWPRLWLLLEKEKKEEIDASWSLADGLLSLSAVALVSGLSWAGAAVARLGGFPPPHAGIPLDASLTAGLASLCLLCLAYLLYRVSLGFHVRNGETFKAVFDLYRKELSPMLKPGNEETARQMDQWRQTWAYLQYLATEEENAKIPPQPTLVATNAQPPQKK